MRALTTLVAVFLMVLLVFQSAARIVWGLHENLLSKGAVAVHVLTLGCIFAIGLWLLTWNRERVAVISAVVWLGTAHAFLTIMDIGLFAAPRFAGVPLTFPFLIDMGCGGRLGLGCMITYFEVAIGLAIVCLVFLVAYGIASKPLNNLALRVFAQLAFFRPRAWVGFFVVSVLTANAFFWEEWSGRDPLHALFLKQYIKGPPGLSTGARALPQMRRAASEIAPRPLVLIIVDAMRADVVQQGSGLSEGMPYLNSLLASGQLVSRGPAVSTCTLSYCGITSLLSSRYWAQLDRPPLTISDELARYGYRSHYLLSGNHRRYFNMRTIYGPNVAQIVDEQDGRSGRNANDLDLLPYLRQLEFADPDRSFLLVHLMSPHALGWKVGANGDVQRAAEAALIGGGGGRGRAAYRHQYLVGLQQADRLIKAVFGELARRRILERAFVIIAADHGERLGESGRFGHGGAPDAPTALVPFLIYDPLGGSYPKRRVTSIVDVAPTFLAAIGATIPSEWSGTPIQRMIGDRAVAIDSEESQGYVASYRGLTWLHVCDTISGKRSRVGLGPDIGGKDANSAKLPAEIYRMVVNLPRRADSGRCTG